MEVDGAARRTVAAALRETGHPGGTGTVSGGDRGAELLAPLRA